MTSIIPPSSDTHDAPNNAGTFKKRRVQRACDMCRKRKIKCSGGENPGESCVNCSVYKWACTFGDPMKNNSSSKSYVEDLEGRLQRTERLLKHLCPDESLLEDLQKRFVETDSIPSLENITSTPPSTFSFSSGMNDSRTKIATNPLVNISTLIRSRAAETGPESIMGAMAKSIRQVGYRGAPINAHPNYNSRNHEEATVRDVDLKDGDLKREQDDEYESEDDASHVLASTLKNLHLEPPEYRFFGKSSGAMLIRRAMEMKSEFVRRSSPSLAASWTASYSNMTMAGSAPMLQSPGHPQGVRQCFETLPALDPPQFRPNLAAIALRQRRGALPLPPTMKNLRPEFWLPRPWEVMTTPPSDAAFTSLPYISSTAASSPHLADHVQMPDQGQRSRLSLDFDFPPPDLAHSLIALYFANMNLFMPLLHRPTFDDFVERGGFLATDYEIPNSKPGGGTLLGDGDRQGSGTGFQFAHIYLLVCAVGAYFSDDPRCLLDPSDLGEFSDNGLGTGAGSERDTGRSGSGLQYSGGWKWFDQVQMSNRSLIAPPTLYDLQVYALSAQFLQASSAPQSAWTMCGIGIRLAQDVGAHRRGHNITDQRETREGELWKKAFWVLVVMDRMFSCHLGRSCAIQDEDFDLDPPVDCDDISWDYNNPDPQKRFKQPSKKPSSMTHFLLYIELTHILTFSMRTIYSINKSQLLCGLIGPNWEQTVVSELDSALNKWADAVPDHLKWDPHRDNVTFFNQSASLWATYHHIRILVHRSFIQSSRSAPSKTSSLSMIPSLPICANAARACCHIVDVQQKRTGPIIAHVQMAVFQSALILLLNIWSEIRSGSHNDLSPQMADVRKCMHILKASEKIWYALGRLCDILFELASVGDILPLEPRESQAPLSHKKRQRKQDCAFDDTPLLTAQATRRENMTPPSIPAEIPAETTSTIPSCYGTASEPAATNDQALGSITSAAPELSQNRSAQLGDLLAPTHNHGLLDSMGYLPVLSAAVALPDIDYVQYAMPFHTISSSVNVPVQHNLENNVSNAPHHGRDSRPQPVIQVPEFATPFDPHQFSSGTVPQDTHNNSDFSAEYSNQASQNSDLMDVWMNMAAGIELEDFGAYLANIDAITQNALGGSVMEWPETDTGYSS